MFGILVVSFLAITPVSLGTSGPSNSLAAIATKISRINSILACWTPNGSLGNAVKFDSLLLKCKSCDRRMSFGSITGAVMGHALKDIEQGVDSYDAMKALLDESTQLLKLGTLQQAKAFMLRVVQEPWFACPACKKASWVE